MELRLRKSLVSTQANLSTSGPVLTLAGKKAESDWWTIVVGAKKREFQSERGGQIFLKELWRARCTKQEYLDVLKRFNDRYSPLRVVIETVAAQEYLTQDAEAWMPVTHRPCLEKCVDRDCV